MGMRILITGGAGLVDSHLAARISVDRVDAASAEPHARGLAV